MSLFAASMELCGIEHSGNATEETTAGRYQNSYGIRAASYINSTTSTEWLGVSSLGSFTSFWHRGFFYPVSDTFGLASSRTLFEYANSSGTPVFRFQLTSTAVIQAQYWNGSSWVNIGSTYTLAIALYKFDFKLVCGASGSFEFSITNNMAIDPPVVLSGSASMGSVTNIDRISSYSTTSSTPSSSAVRHSEWIWGDESTVGHRYAFAAPTGNGTDTAGSGAFGDVDEAVTNDVDLSTLAANGDAETYTHGTMTLPAGTVKAVVVESRVRNVAGGAQNVKARLRIGGTAYDQASNYSGISGSFTGYRARWATNPAGGSWTQTTAGQTSNEFGLLAQT